ncbi:hypothetical protein ACFQT0_00625 [Hymenobacter humi]|uniref:PH domain-containing protein n=1 Tax=Hymenobacter humi TaxID=1411620 RepID=A0ABW2TZI3_9BACT
MYTISYRKIALEFAALNLLLLICLSQLSLSFQALCWLIASIYAVALLAFFIPRRVYQVLVQPQAMVLSTFRFGGRRKALRVSYTDLEVTYRKELVGKGIHQLKVRVYERGTLRAILAPSFSGWQHDTLDELVADLNRNKVGVRTDGACGLDCLDSK